MAIITNSILESVGCKTTIVPNGISLIQEFKEILMVMMPL